jgi:hypothetical protein
MDKNSVMRNPIIQ